MNTLQCDCKEWDEGAKQIFAAQVQHTLHTGVQYTGSKFRYCPFCGKKLIHKEECMSCGAILQDGRCPECGAR